MHVYKKIYTGSTPTTQKNDIGPPYANVGSFYANVSNGSGAGGRAYLSFTVNGYKNIVVKWTAESGSYATVMIGIANSVPTNSTWYLPAESIFFNLFAKGTKVSKKTTQTTTVTFNNLTGTKYVYLNVYSGSSVDAYAAGAISEAILWSS